MLKEVLFKGGECALFVASDQSFFVIRIVDLSLGGSMQVVQND